MLRRQSWSHRCWSLSLSQFALHGLRIYRAANFNVRYYSLTPDPSPRNRHGTSAREVTESSIPRAIERFDRTKRKEHQSNVVSRILDPWVNPSSLSESLDAHRRANREGIARDGVLVKSKITSKKAAEMRTHRGLNPPKILRLADIVANPKVIPQYGGVSPPLLSVWRPGRSLTQRLQYPWLSKLNTLGSGDFTQSATDRLNNEIEACKHYFSPTVLERKAASNAFTQIRKVLKDLCGANSIDLIGSRAAGTDNPTSDLDINLSIAFGFEGVDDAKLAKRYLLKLDKALRQEEFQSIVLPHTFVRQAQIPILVGTHLPSGLEFQIQSVSNTHDSLEVTKAFVAEYPSADILFKIIKQILVMRGLTKGVLGGVTSYPLLNMIVASLKLAETPPSQQDVASQLLHFLDFWSEFNCEKQKIVFEPVTTKRTTSSNANCSFDPISAIPKIVSKNTKSDKKAYMLSLQDPADLSNDLGKNLFGIKHVQACFIEAREQLHQSMQHWDDNVSHGETYSNTTPLLGWCLGGDYTMFEEARWRLHKYSQEGTSN